LIFPSVALPAERRKIKPLRTLIQIPGAAAIKGSITTINVTMKNGELFF
jgi:hypothetical protein